jgi:hypothetical protein
VGADVVDLDDVVRPARWVEYPALASLAARRLGESRSADRPPAGPLRRMRLWGATFMTLAAYGGWTTDRHQAVASSWLLDGDEWAPVLRAGPVLVPIFAAELAIFAVSPPWVPVVMCGLILFGLSRLLRTWRARAGLRESRRPGALYIANLASREKGAGAVVLDHLVATATARGIAACLEASAHPDLIDYYTRHGFDELRTVDAGGERVVYMERPAPGQSSSS